MYARAVIGMHPKANSKIIILFHFITIVIRVAFVIIIGIVCCFYAIFSTFKRHLCKLCSLPTAMMHNNNKMQFVIYRFLLCGHRQNSNK